MAETLESLKPHLDKAVSILNVSKMVIPADKAPKLYEAVGLLADLVQTPQFAAFAVFSVNWLEETVKRFAHKAQE